MIAMKLVETLRAAAREDARKGHHEMAAAKYQKLLEIAPDDLAALHELAFLHSTPLHREDEAQALYDRILAAHPADVEALFWSAWCLFGYFGLPEQLAVAKDRLRRVIELHRQGQERYVAHSCRLLASEEFELAPAERLELYEKAIAIAPDIPNGYRRLGEFLETQGHFDAALAAMKTALRYTKLRIGDDNVEPKQYCLEEAIEGSCVSADGLQDLLQAIDRVLVKIGSSPRGPS